MVYKNTIWGMMVVGGIMLIADARESYAWWPSPWESWWLDNPWFDSPLGGRNGYPGYRDYSSRRRRWGGYGYDEPWNGYRSQPYRYDYYGDYSGNWDNEWDRYYGGGRYERGRPYYGDDWGYHQGYDYGRDYSGRDFGYDSPNYRNYGYSPPTNERGGYSGNYYDRDSTHERPYSGYGNNNWDNSRNNNSWGNSGYSNTDSWNNTETRPWSNSNNSSQYNIKSE